MNNANIADEKINVDVHKLHQNQLKESMEVQNSQKYNKIKKQQNKWQSINKYPTN